MKIYVAGKWTDKKRVSEVMRILEKHGHEITFDWTAFESKNFKEGAIQDMRAVKEADAFYLVYSEDMKGAWTEFGAALALGLPCYVTGEAIYCNNIFLSHPLVRLAYTLADEPLNQEIMEKYSTDE